MDVDKHVLTAAKVAFFIYIILSPFIDHKYISFLNTTFAKVILLVLIVVVSFVDLQLAIIMTLAFLVLIVNLNKDVIFGVKKTSAPMPQMPLSEHFLEETKKADTIYEFPQKCNIGEVKRDQISTDLYDLYLDPKIKPYEAYIRALSTPSAIEEASESKIIGWD